MTSPGPEYTAGRGLVSDEDTLKVMTREAHERAHGGGDLPRATVNAMRDWLARNGPLGDWYGVHEDEAMDQIARRYPGGIMAFLTDRNPA